MIELFDDSASEHHLIDLKTVKRIVRKDGNTLSTYNIKIYFHDGEILEMQIDDVGLAALTAASIV